jgi:hypothetical protein
MAGRLGGSRYHVVSEAAGGDTAAGDHAGEAADGVCAAAEAKEVELVAGLVDVRDLRVAILDLLQDGLAEGALEDAGEASSAGSDAIVVVGNLVSAYRQRFV